MISILNPSTRRDPAFRWNDVLHVELAVAAYRLWSCGWSSSSRAVCSSRNLWPSLCQEGVQAGKSNCLLSSPCPVQLCSKIEFEDFSDAQRSPPWLPYKLHVQSCGNRLRKFGRPVSEDSKRRILCRERQWLQSSWCCIRRIRCCQSSMGNLSRSPRWTVDVHLLRWKTPAQSSLELLRMSQAICWKNGFASPRFFASSKGNLQSPHNTEMSFPCAASWTIYTLDHHVRPSGSPKAF